ncbi:MAG: Slp family lipoprotein [Candidatus Competibacteraceae bacterium]
MLMWLGGCATVSPPPTTPVASSASVPALTLVPASIRAAPPGDLSLAEAAAGPEVHRGARVRWGGNIVALQSETGWTRLEIQQHPLDRNGQPQSESGSAGRFYARAAIPFDPQVYAPGRQITVAGVLTGMAATGGAGSASSLPVVEATELYLWGSTVAHNDEPLFRPRQPSRTFNLFDFLSGLPFSVGLGVGYGKGWNGHSGYWGGWGGYYPGYWGGWGGYYPRYWGGWRGYYPGYWWPRSGLYFGTYR